MVSIHPFTYRKYIHTYAPCNETTDRDHIRNIEVSQSDEIGGGVPKNEVVCATFFLGDNNNTW